ncbi:MAG: 3-dehydroquinate synthase family protein [Microthrixaceae bacterium]
MEAHKRLSTIEHLCSSWSLGGDQPVGLRRVGGWGMVTDVAGFAASVYHRGLPVVHVATSLLAQVDAAIGGKTGVNLPEGKNLVGSFWQPSAVVCDTETLDSLPPEEWRCGLGEVAKYHWLGAGPLDGLGIVEQVAACVRTKARFVCEDEREGGRRALLNYGHTLAHALETVGEHELRHGEAVSIGLVFAAELARALGRVDDSVVTEHRRVVGAYGLPSGLPAGTDLEELVAVMGRDKKSLGSGLTFVLDGGVPDAHGVTVEVVRDVDPATVLEVLGSLG